MLPNLLSHTVLPHLTQQLLHLRTRALQVLVNDINATSNFPTRVPRRLDFATQRSPQHFTVRRPIPRTRRKEQVPLPRLLNRDIPLPSRPKKRIRHLRHPSNDRSEGAARLLENPRVDETRVVVDEADAGCVLGDGFEAEVNHRAHVSADGVDVEERDFVASEVVGEDGSFFCAGEDGHDAAEGRGGLEEGQQVDDKAGPGVDR